jgi:hypothetical protein
VEHTKLIGHGAKAFRLTPSGLHRGVNLRRQFPDFTHESFERPRRRRAEHLHEVPRHGRRASGQQGEARAYDPDARQETAKARHLDRAAYKVRLSSIHRYPFGRWIHEHHTTHLLRILRRIGQAHERTERMADDHAQRRTVHLGDDRMKIVNHPSERAARRRLVAPTETGPIVGADPRESRDFRLHA